MFLKCALHINQINIYPLKVKSYGYIKTAKIVKTVKTNSTTGYINYLYFW